MKKLLATSLIAGSCLLPVVAMAQPGDGGAGPKKMHEHVMVAPKVLHPHMMGRDMMHFHAMALAEHLAAIETAVGIRSDQLDAWRKYTSSYMDMMFLKPPAEDATEQQKPLFGERMADRVIERAEKAKAFKDASAELRKVLDEKQLERLTNFAHMQAEMMHERAKEGIDHKPMPPHMKK